MQTIRAILPVLALLLLASSASAQDMPDIVLVEVNLTWAIPGLPDVQVTGSNLWQNGVGYVENRNLTTQWTVTGGEPGGLGYANVGMFFEPKFFLRLEALFPPIPGRPAGGEVDIFVPFGPITPTDRLLPGDYAISQSRYSDQVPLGRMDSFSPPSGYQRVVAVPELAILRSFTRRLGGQQLNDLVNPTLQRLTAWGAATLLGATSSGAYVVLPTTILEVQEWCSGVASMKWLMILALALGLVGRMSVPWTALFIVAAALIGLETNVVRVAAIGAGFAKEWTGWGAIGFGAVQVVGLGWVMNRRARP
jgi:exosortase/archaeosortase family protein